MISLDDPAVLSELDPGDMHGAIAGFPGQIREAIRIGNHLVVDPNCYRNVENIIVCGMGGSAIGGEITLSLLYRSLPIPMYACRNYYLPSYAGKNSLVIGSSYSGNTEETLTAFEQARQEGCSLFALTTGGKLGKLAVEYDLPCIILPLVGLQPRAALAYSIVPMLLFFNKIDFADYDPNRFVDLASFLEIDQVNYRMDRPLEDNPAKQLALKLHGSIPIIYSGPTLTDGIATRFKGQISENGKMLAFTNQFPEFNHNELVGWEELGDYGQYFKVIILHDQEDYQQVKTRMGIVRSMLKDKGIEVIDLETKGSNRLERIFSLIHMTDFVSYYLGILNEVDPTPVKPIEYLKSRL